MLHLDAKNTNSNPSFTSLLAFKPRQVLLAHRNPTKTMNVCDSASTDENNTKITKGNLHKVLLDYFHRNGFSKTLKRFKSEAQIQTDVWKTSLPYLEDMFCKYNPCDADSNKSTSNEPGNVEAMEKEKACTTNEETTTKKKKKKVIVEIDDNAHKKQSEVADKKLKESTKSLGHIFKDIIVELETQPKKKKTKHDLVSSTDDAINGLKVDDLAKKIKDKKKKNIEKVKSELPTTNGNDLVTDVAQKKEKKKKKNMSTDENEVSQLDMTKKEKKSSKKRKRSFSDENKNENVYIEMTTSEESKCQKTRTFKEEKSIREGINAQETSNKQFDEVTNGKLEKDRVKSKKKQLCVTMEPKTINAFQRVKVDEVEFAHDKLQDDSYWAKDGAEIGYGAKAQEVLGQVRGRDFRHEKTKKKRGSYRGGLIDQQSHSIKFTYNSDEE
ncbi:hypothetical protein R6Q57_020455 [Mikania cordata]